MKQDDNLVELKTSAYNVIERTADNDVLLGNVMSGAVVRLSGTMEHGLLCALSTPGTTLRLLRVHRNTVLLRESGFVVAPGMNELAELRRRWERSRRGRDTLALAIIPTLSCNFRCTYCYERHEAVDMSRAVQLRTLAYVNRNISNRKVLKIVWFGGEPLIRQSLIGTMSAELIAEARGRGVSYQATAVTNGYLLSRTTVERLRAALVSRLQITLDGPQEDHDSRRVLAGGRPTYKRILRNVLESAHCFEELILRVNIDRRNSHSLGVLLADLTPVRERVVLAFRPAHSPEPQEPEPSWCMPPTDWVPFHAELVHAARSRGFSVAHGYALPGTPFCSAYQLNSLTVDPYGDVHRCPVFVGRRDLRLGRLTDSGDIELFAGPQREWQNRSPFEDPHCVRCRTLPICMGGCPYHSASGQSSYRCFAANSVISGLVGDYFLDKARAVGAT